MPQTVQLINIGRVQNTRIVAGHKPTKEPLRQGTCCIRVMGQEHKPRIHLQCTPVELQNGPIQWTTTIENVSLYTLCTKHCKYIFQKFTPSLSLTLASERILNSEKKKIEIPKSER